MIPLLRKDLLVLRRSPALLGVLVAYPLLVALLVNVVAGYGSSRPRVAYVDLDGVPDYAGGASEDFEGHAGSGYVRVWSGASGATVRSPTFVGSTGRVSSATCSRSWASGARVRRRSRAAAGYVS